MNPAARPSRFPVAPETGRSAIRIAWAARARERAAAGRRPRVRAGRFFHGNFWGPDFGLSGYPPIRLSTYPASISGASMKFGVIETLDAGPARGPGDRLRRLARAEEQGYRAAWIRAAGDSTRASDAGRSLFAASWLAARTESISVGLWAPLPPDLHPLRLAEDLAVLDLLSGGRLEWAPGGEAFSESLEIVLRAWSGEAFSHAGERFEFPELQCTPRPAQRPHPRLWLAPGVAPPPLAHAARSRLPIARVSSSTPLSREMDRSRRVGSKNSRSCEGDSIPIGYSYGPGAGSPTKRGPPVFSSFL